MREAIYGSIVIGSLLASLPVAATGAQLATDPGGAVEPVATDGSPLQLADLLRQAGHPVGVIIHQETYQEVRDLPLRLDSPAPGRFDTAELLPALEQFERTHEGWRGEMAGDAVLLRDETVGSRSDGQRVFEIRARSLTEAFLLAQKSIADDVDVTVGGSVTSRMFGLREGGRPQVPLERVSEKPIDVSVIEDSLWAVLTAIATADPGTAWVLIRHQSPAGQYDTLTVRYSDGIFVEFPWKLWIGERGSK